MKATLVAVALLAVASASPGQEATTANQAPAAAPAAPATQPPPKPATLGLFYIFEALALAVIFIYLILAAQFESFIDPLAIMLSLPLSLVGVVLVLYANRGHPQYHVAHRPHHAHGAGDQECHLVGGLQQSAAR